MSFITITPTSIPFTKNSLYLNDKTDKDLLIMNGEYYASASSQLSDKYQPYNVFNGTTKKPWISARSKSFNYTRDPYDNKHRISKYVGGGDGDTHWHTKVGHINVEGEWLQITLPNPIILIQYSILTYSSPKYENGRNFPKVFFVLGSNDETTWHVVDQQSLQSMPEDVSSPVEFKVYSSNKFKTFRFIFHQLFSGSAVSISQINMFGSNRIVVNKEPFSTLGNTIISPSNLRNMSIPNTDYTPYNKYEDLYTTTSKTIETFDTTTGNINISQDLNTYGNIYNELTTNTKYVNEYTGNYRSDKNLSYKDGIEGDSRTLLIQQNNMFLLATITVAILTLGAIVLSK
uniref:Uncharacterized protein n=1 Tax=viral metagenome TaxID=1070528 RepID=A0A6C0DUI9_9ZZZZ